MVKILPDSSVFLDYFLRGPKKEKSRRYVLELSENKGSGVISSICLLEVKYHITRNLGHQKAEEAMFFIKNIENLTIVDLNDNIAEMAADIRIKYYSKECPLSFADAIHVATAIVANCGKIVSADADFSYIKEIKSEKY